MRKHCGLWLMMYRFLQLFLKRTDKKLNPPRSSQGQWGQWVKNWKFWPDFFLLHPFFSFIHLCFSVATTRNDQKVFFLAQITTFWPIDLLWHWWPRKESYGWIFFFKSVRKAESIRLSYAIVWHNLTQFEFIWGVINKNSCWKCTNLL